MGETRLPDTDPATAPNIRYDARPPVLLVAQPDAPDRLAAAVAALGGRIVARAGWGAPLPLAAQSIVAVETAGVAPNLLAAALPAIADTAAARGLPLVVALAAAQIDAVAAVALGGGTALLVEPSVGDCVAALAIAAERLTLPDGVSDVGRDSDSARLERLSAEVARIADTLARLTRDEQDRGAAAGIVGDRTTGYGAPPPTVPAPTAADIRRTIRARRLRDQFFGEGLFEDPGWDMLLDLFAAELEGTDVSVSSLCIAAAVAPTTALRWIGRMTDGGLFERSPDPNDRRRAFMALSRRASAAMLGYMTALTRGELRVA